MGNKVPVVHTRSDVSAQVNFCCPVHATRQWNSSRSVQDTGILITRSGQTLMLNEAGKNEVAAAVIRKDRRIVRVRFRAQKSLSCCAILCYPCTCGGASCCKASCCSGSLHLEEGALTDDSFIYNADKKREATFPDCCAAMCSCVAALELVCVDCCGIDTTTLLLGTHAAPFFANEVPPPQQMQQQQMQAMYGGPPQQAMYGGPPQQAMYGGGYPPQQQQQPQQAMYGGGYPQQQPQPQQATYGGGYPPQQQAAPTGPEGVQLAPANPGGQSPSQQ